MKIRFENPPINELVMATYFNPPLFSLRSEHIGLFWSKIRDEFPTATQQQPVGGAETVGPIGGEFFPMPRFWFMAEDEIKLIQVQKNAFMINWRRRDSEYPHFAENLKPAFDKYYRVFEDFARADAGVEEIKIDQCELSYINTIEACEYWRGPQDTARVIPSFSRLETGGASSAAQAFNCAYVYTLAQDLQLRVVIRNGEAAAKPRTPVLIVEIKATGRLGQTAEIPCRQPCHRQCARRGERRKRAPRRGPG